jgi:HK97 family phage major capsid protein
VRENALAVGGSAAVTAEGASKPELTMPATSQVVHVQKIAVHVGISWESLQDWEAFRASVTTELTNRVIDVENSELLAGDGTTGHLTGLLGTSGILTHDGSVTLGGLTAIDHIEESIAELRGRQQLGRGRRGHLPSVEVGRDSANEGQPGEVFGPGGPECW